MDQDKMIKSLHKRGWNIIIHPRINDKVYLERGGTMVCYTSIEAAYNSQKYTRIKK